MALSAVNQKFAIENLLTKLAAPLNLGRFANKIPQVFNKLVVESLLNRAFEEQIMEGDFDFLYQRTIQLEITDAEIFIALSFDKNKLRCVHFNNFPVESQASLSIETINAIRLIQQEVDPDTLFFQRQLTIAGDTELAHQMKNTIDTFNQHLIPSVVMKLLSEYQTRILEKA